MSISPLSSHKKRGSHSHAEGAKPPKKQKSGVSPASLRWLFSEFKRSISGYMLYGDWFFRLTPLPLRLLGLGDCLSFGYHFGFLGFWLSLVSIGITTSS
jgi:hypothetical protein